MQARRVFTVAQRQPVVQEFLADFSSTEQWDPGTQTCVRTDDGPLRVGSTWHNVSVFRGRHTELTYTLDVYEQDHLRFLGTNKTARTIDDLRMAAVDEAHTQIAYTGDISFAGLVKLAEPLLRRGFRQLADETVRQLTQTLEAL